MLVPAGPGSAADREDPGLRQLVEDAAGAEGELLAGEDDGGAVRAGLERPLGGRLDGHHDAAEARVLAAADRPAFGRQRGRGADERREAEGGGADHAARLCLEALSAPSSSL